LKIYFAGSIEKLDILNDNMNDKRFLLLNLLENRLCTFFYERETVRLLNLKNKKNKENKNYEN